ncbi:WxL domain-containing protein [Pontibacillus sp. ALD_SL1]|uniref:WxL domain-containing protein n=1 Tax=Pontibacillus sp. ALD_SL1 TaxID=2777185 RepID=UPI001F60A20D|nr:WxL domain-containing protein [Pontibacillus sp. ALD_SL1]
MVCSIAIAIGFWIGMKESLFALGGSGTSGDPYIITTCVELQDVKNLDTDSGTGGIQGYFELGNDIDCLEARNWNAGAGFAPIGGQFKGSFEGNGHIITDLYIHRPTKDYTGLFSKVGNGAILQNFGVQDADITGDRYVGIIAGQNNRADLYRLFATGKVAGYDEAGGILGIWSGGLVQNVYSLADVEATDDAGGAIAYVGDILANELGYIYSASNLSGVDRGGLTSYLDEGDFQSSFWDTERSGVVGTRGGTGKTTAEMKQQSTYTGWDFTNTWAMDPSINGGYPYLQGIEPHAKGALRGSGTSGDPYIITTCEGLQNIPAYDADAGTNAIQGYFELGKDIDCQETVNWNGGLGFEPIRGPFAGHFDGKGFVITGLTINRPAEDYVGLFGEVSNAAIEGVGLVSVNVTGKNNVGGLAGGIMYTDVSTVYATGAVTGENQVGGVLGFLNDSTILNAYSHVITTGNDGVGGVVGFIYEIYFDWSKHVYAAGSVTGNAHTGGLSGGTYGPSEIEESYWDTEETGQSTSTDGAGKTTAEMKQETTYSGWDFSNIWSIDPLINGGYPYLQSVTPDSKLSIRPSGSGTSGDPYIITTCVELQSIQKLDTNLNNVEIDGVFHLGNDLDCSETVYWYGGQGFSPIGVNNAEFVGTFDGKGYKIMDLTINRPSQSTLGIFGHTMFNASISDAVIRNVGIENINVTGKNVVGTLVGYAERVEISSVFVIGTATGVERVGGLVGGMSFSTLSNIYTRVGVNASLRRAGGISATEGNNDLLENVYATGSITTPYYDGGLVFYGDNAFLRSFWDVDTTGVSVSDSGTGKTTSQMKQQSTYTGWDFANVWAIDPSINDGYPHLQNVLPDADTNEISEEFSLEAPDVTGVPSATIGETAEVTWSFSGPLLITDTRASPDGWHVTVSASPLAEVGGAGLTFPAGSIALLPPESITGDNPPSLTGGFFVLDDGSASTILSSLNGEGTGVSAASFPNEALVLTVPADKVLIDPEDHPGGIVVYKTTIQWELSAGP